MTETAPASPTVTCTRCGTRSPLGARQCTSATCRCLLPGNPGRAGEVPGLSTAQREGRSAFSERNDKLFESFVDQVTADLGGIDRISMIEMALIEMAGQQYVITAMLQEYLNEVGALTPRGRVRTATAALNQAVQCFDRIAQKLGLVRREGWERAHRAMNAPTPEQIDEDDLDDEDVNEAEEQ